MKTITKFFSMLLIATSLMAGFASCSEEIDKSNRYTFTGETIADFILNREDRFSHMIKILNQAEMFGLLSTWGKYTFFLPENAGVEEYLREQYEIWDSTKNLPQPTWTGITSPELEDLSDSMALVIAHTHIVPFTYELAEMQEGALDTRNYNDRYLSVSFITVDEKFRIVINNQAGITEGDNLVENGVVHITDKVVSPSTNTLPKLLSDHPYFTLMSAALIETGFDSKLQGYKALLNGEEYALGNEKANGWDPNAGKARYPHTYYTKYTGFIETDDVFAAEGIYSLNDLKAFAEKWYGTEDSDKPTSPNNALYKFIAYHFLNRELAYNTLVQYGLEQQSYKSEGPNGFVQGVDRVEYFETMLEGTLVKVCKPLSSDTPFEAQNIFLNFSHRTTKQQEMDKHLDIRIIDLTTFTAMDEKYADFVQAGLNGTIHPIDKILVYNEDEMKGNVLNERMRFDVSAIFPELTSNGVRWGRWQQAGTESGYGDYNIPAGYCKDMKFNDTSTEFHYFCPYTWGCNYQGDEIIVVGKYDLEYRLPPVPEGTYELRMGYTATSRRSVTQFYVDGKVTGIPVDLRILATDPRIGWEDDTVTEDDGVENDKAMRNRGYMKGPDSYYMQSGDPITAREHNGAIRIIITQKLFEKGDHWIRMKKVDEYEPNDEFNHDYFELVPKNIITSHIPEDRL